MPDPFCVRYLKITPLPLALWVGGAESSTSSLTSSQWRPEVESTVKAIEDELGYPAPFFLTDYPICQCLGSMKASQVLLICCSLHCALKGAQKDFFSFNLQNGYYQTPVSELVFLTCCIHVSPGDDNMTNSSVVSREMTGLTAEGDYFWSSATWTSCRTLRGRPHVCFHVRSRGQITWSEKPESEGLHGVYFFIIAPNVKTLI